jgi:peptidoglycan hydrolase CwlO-like protein
MYEISELENKLNMAKEEQKILFQKNEELKQLSTEQADLQKKIRDIKQKNRDSYYNMRDAIQEEIESTKNKTAELKSETRYWENKYGSELRSIREHENTSSTLWFIAQFLLLGSLMLLFYTLWR